jgi:hypothetical protein
MSMLKVCALSLPFWPVRVALVAGMVWSGAVGFLSPAEAQVMPVQFWGHPAPMFDEDDELTPGELQRLALAQGFRIVSRPRYGDDYAVARAQDRAGRSVQITLDAFSGQVVHVRAMAQPPRPPAQVERVQPQREASVPPKPVTPRKVEPSAAPPPVAAPGNKATPERPTVIRREPMLPAPSAPSASAASGAPSVGSGTRSQPRRIEIVPPSGNSPSGSTPPI